MQQLFFKKKNASAHLKKNQSLCEIYNEIDANILISINRYYKKESQPVSSSKTMTTRNATSQTRPNCQDC